MSKIGRRPIPLPQGVEVAIEKNKITLKGPKGEVSFSKPEEIDVASKEGFLVVRPLEKKEELKPLWGLVRSKLNGAVEGVAKGYKRTLKLVGLGYRVFGKGDDISLAVGFTNPIEFTPPQGIKLEVEGNDTIHVSGADKELVGLVTAKIRAFRPPEPYKGKGIMLKDEVIRRKEGKAGKVGVGVAAVAAK